MFRATKCGRWASDNQEVKADEEMSQVCENSQEWIEVKRRSTGWNSGKKPMGLAGGGGDNQPVTNNYLRLINDGRSMDTTKRQQQRGWKRMKRRENEEKR